MQRFYEILTAFVSILNGLQPSGLRHIGILGSHLEQFAVDMYTRPLVLVHSSTWQS